MREAITMERASQREGASNSYPLLRSRSLRDGSSVRALYEDKPLYNGPGLLRQTNSRHSVTAPPVISALSTPAVRCSPSSTLTINQPNDRFEEEANRVSDQIMRMPSAAIAQRRCASCEQKDERSGEAQRKHATSGEPSILQRFDSGAGHSIGFYVAPPIVHEVLRSPGQPLDGSTRAFMEPRFGLDFSRIRIHADVRAAESARSVNALAYTVGNDIVFGAGQYAPSTDHGVQLMAHELTHVVQQGGGSPLAATSPVNLAVPAPGKLQRQFAPFDLAGGLTEDLIGITWLHLPRSLKEQIIDRTISLAITIVDKFPGKVVIGDLWPLIQAGLLGFYEKLKSATTDIKIRAIDKLATIMGGQDQQFSLAFAKGLLKGFFIDGMLGIFVAIWDLGKALAGLWGFFKQIAATIGGFPEEIQAKLQEFQTTLQELLGGRNSAIDEFKKLITDPKQFAALVTAISQQAKSFAKQAGAGVADSLLNFFSQPSASADIGSAVGDIVGIALWEVLFAVFTAGGGEVVNVVKDGAELLGKALAKAVQSILRVVEELQVLFRRVIEGIKGALRFVQGKLASLGERFGELLGEIGDFFELLLRNCHESTLACKFSAKIVAQIEKVITELETVAKRVPGVKTLVTRIRTTKIQSFVHGLVFQAERAIEYAKQGELLGIEVTEVVSGKVARFDMLIDLARIRGGEGVTEFILETKNWTGFSKLGIIDQERRLLKLGQQLSKFAKTGRPIIVEWKGAAPPSLRSFLKAFKTVTLKEIQ